LNLAPEVLRIDMPQTERQLVDFIKDYVRKTQVKGVVVGLSGGIDSSTVAALSAKAVGGNKVLGICLPERQTWNEQDIQHARDVSQLLAIQFKLIDITSMVETTRKVIPDYDFKQRVPDGNVKARSRMVILYYYANSLQRLVVGSGDKSEIMLGYFTKWGDYCADLAPLADLFKTQVQALARHLNLPEEIVAKTPTPALWPGQSAEGELGLKYDVLDLILYGLEHFMLPEEISRQLNLPLETATRIEERWLHSEHKRRPPLAMKTGYRTVAHDLRLPYSL
jgi:NAD+ synthase